MGSTVGVFDDEEVKGLSKEDLELLRKAAIQYLLTSEEIRGIISQEGTLPTLLQNHPEVREVLRGGLEPVLKRLKK
jgi:hypothetical protein